MQCRVYSTGYRDDKLTASSIVKILGTFHRIIIAIDDLGVRFDRKLTFSPHVSHACAKASRALYFIKRAASDFKRIFTLKTLYQTIVLPHLTYCSVIFYPLYAKDFGHLERIQHLFLRFAAFKRGTPMSRTEHDYGTIRTELRLLNICDHFKLADICFLHNILNSRIDCKDLLGSINLCAMSRNLRRKLYFRIGCPKSHYGTRDPIYRCCETANSFFSCLDLFNGSPQRLKAQVISELERRNS